MTGSTVPIAPIPLARSNARLTSSPAIFLAAGVTAAAGGALRGDLWGIGLVAAGLVVAVLSLALWGVLLSVRLDVEVATLRLRWLGGERRYQLVRGPVTRVPLRGRDAARLRPSFGTSGWGLGRAKLRRDEAIEMVRLAATDTMILVPTDHGRVGVAPASEQQFLNALAAAARIQQRLDEVAERARAFAPPPPPEPAAAEPAEPQPAEPGARVITGIERAILEQRLAAQRAAALNAAVEERQAAADAARMAAFMTAEEASGPKPVPIQRPAQRRVVALPSVRVRRPSMQVRGDRLRDFVVLALPAVVAVGVWLAAALQQRLDLPPEQLRPVAAALLATGPAAALAGIVARVWYPRLLGLVTLTSLIGAVLVARALLA
jgi:hypothetical protein